MRWIEDREQNFRGNHTSMMVVFDNANAHFVPQCQMTYKCFRSFVSRLGKFLHATECVITETDYSKTLVVVYENGDQYKFWIEPEDAKSVADRIYLSVEDLRKDKLPYGN